MSNIYERIKKIITAIPDKVTLLAATKTRSCDEIRQALQAGIFHLGENYVQEAENKKKILAKEKAVWHCIGHLQKNKAAKAAKLFDWIDSLDSLELAEKLEKELARINKKINILIQINIAKERQKSGILPENLFPLINQIVKYNHLILRGLMTLGPWVDNPEKIRPYFAKMNKLFREVKNKYAKDLPYWDTLSMGMSDTYLIAIEEGANLIRLGTVIFGPRRVSKS